VIIVVFLDMFALYSYLYARLGVFCMYIADSLVFSL
jgi:hypothetical protein